IGALILGEASAAPTWVIYVFAVAGAIAVWGVVGLARYHPQVLSESQELGIQRGSNGGRDRGAEAPSTGSGASRGSEATPGSGTSSGSGSGPGRETGSEFRDQ
ncbi:MAG: multidrug DMT transporter permease, partial [Microbacterium sp.]|nr:multidrug DMT transporter permease [Microbacterium sp.]